MGHAKPYRLRMLRDLGGFLERIVFGRLRLNTRRANPNAHYRGGDYAVCEWCARGLRWAPTQKWLHMGGGPTCCREPERG